MYLRGGSKSFYSYSEYQNFLGGAPLNTPTNVYSMSAFPRDAPKNCAYYFCVYTIASRSFLIIIIRYKGELIVVYEQGWVCLRRAGSGSEVTKEYTGGGGGGHND